MENKVYKIGEVLAKITEKEYKDLQSYNESQQALRKMIGIFIEVATKKEEEYQINVVEWWERMKLKYKLPIHRELNKYSYFGGDLILKLSNETKEIFIGSNTK